MSSGPIIWRATMPKVELSWTGRLARLRFADPANRNAFNHAFCTDFARASLDAAAGAPSAILLEAEGDAFCVGGDIAEFLRERDRIERHVLELATLFHAGIERLNGTGAPILTGSTSNTVVGWTAGGGVEYALTWNWFIKAEYLYASFSNQTASQVTGGFPTLTGTTTANLNANILRGGFDYRF